MAERIKDVIKSDSPTIASEYAISEFSEEKIATQYEQLLLPA
jgi:hypothetical protein